MPVPKRYFKVSQEINHDPEMWTLTEKYGDRALRTWLEILVYLDRSQNHWRMVDGWLASLSRTVRQTPATVQAIVGQLLASRWLEVVETSADGSPLVVRACNWMKYNRTPEQKGNSKGTDDVPLPSFPPPSPSLPVPKEKEKKKIVVLPQRAQQLEALHAFSLTEDLETWAMQEHRAVIPGHVLVEFKDYWREQKKLRTNWAATFQNRVCALIRSGVIVPRAVGSGGVERKCKSAKDGACEDVAVAGSEYCQSHKEFYASVRARMAHV